MYLHAPGYYFWCLLLKTVSSCIAQAGPEVSFLLSRPAECWDDRSVPPHSCRFCSFIQVVTVCCLSPSCFFIHALVTGHLATSYFGGLLHSHNTLTTVSCHDGFM